jgi:hypothetical protein
MRSGLDRLCAAFPVTIQRLEVGGVPADVVRPAAGAIDDERILLNLHGGGFRAGAGLGGRQESVPIAALGRIPVITVDYRQFPEHRFPAASEDVAAVYQALLEDYPPSPWGSTAARRGAFSPLRRSPGSRHMACRGQARPAFLEQAGSSARLATLGIPRHS